MTTARSWSKLFVQGWSHELEMNKTGNAGIFAEILTVWNILPLWEHASTECHPKISLWFYFELNFSHVRCFIRCCIHEAKWSLDKVMWLSNWSTQPRDGLGSGERCQGKEEDPRQAKDLVMEVENFKIWTLLLDLLDLYEKASKDGHVNLESFLELADNHGIQVENAKLEFFFFQHFQLDCR